MKFFCIILFVFPLAIAAQQVPLKKGMLINHSITIKNAAYQMDADTSLSVPLMVIEGNNIVVDFNNAILQSRSAVNRPNLFHGLAILIKKGSSNIVLKNTNIHGYKIAVMAEDVEHLSIENCNFSYNYRQQLHSNWQREDISDWMSYHHNENKEWLRYGAGIYLDHCNGAIIKNNTVTNGQCALMMTNCDSATVAENNFSFNSGLGIGMYRSSFNRIYSNRLDFNVRGFSFGKYYRGQDSAGILVFEQCNNNVFAYNSATHSGDGFFLWGGQTTMDTGEGGCNDNLLYGNDFSYAPTNGVELTFSRNRIEKNIIEGCDHAVWGGYSYQTAIIRNSINDNRIGIAIEHGQWNSIAGNSFNNNKTSIKLWSRAQQPADWIYAQKRNTASKQYQISRNDFSQEKTVFDVMGTDSISLSKNSFHTNGTLYKLGERVSNLDTTSELADNAATLTSTIDFIKIKTIPRNTFPYGRKQMRINEWGPYNFGFPCLFLDSVYNGKYFFTVLHPGGNWKMINAIGFAVSSSNDDEIIATADSSIQNRQINLAYTGAAIKDMFGKQQAVGRAYPFGYTEFDPLCKWNINFYKWSVDPNNFDAFTQSLTAPAYSTTASKIDFTWWGEIGKQLPKDSFATVAETEMNLPAGDYEISITADDMAKLLVDGKTVIDAWDKKYTLLDENTNHPIKIHLGGKHHFKLVHAEVEGLADLVLYIKPYK